MLGFSGAVAIAFGLAVAVGATSVQAASKPLPACGGKHVATISPQKGSTPTDLDLNERQTFAIRYDVKRCDLKGKHVRSTVLGLDNPDAVKSARLEGFGNGIGNLRLSFDKTHAPAGSNTITIITSGKLARTSVLSLPLNKSSSSTWAWIIVAIAGVGGLAITALRSVQAGDAKPWWRTKATFVLVALGAFGGAIGVYYEAYASSSHWVAGSDWWSFLLKAGTAAIAGATAAEIVKNPAAAATKKTKAAIKRRASRWGASA